MRWGDSVISSECFQHLGGLEAKRSVRTTGVTRQALFDDPHGGVGRDLFRVDRALAHAQLKPVVGVAPWGAKWTRRVDCCAYFRSRAPAMLNVHPRTLGHRLARNSALQSTTK